jgi:hypothetical protein
LGAEQIELREARQWSSADVERVRALLRRFITIPKLAIPQPITAVAPHKDDMISVWVPAELPTRTLPRQFDFLVKDEPSSYWLQLARRPRTEADRARWVNDLSRRVILAKALGPGRIFLPAPFELSDRGGRPAWQPTEEFLALRTLFHYLSGKAAVAAMRSAPDTLAILFEGGNSSCMVIWSWREDPLDKPAELYLGNEPRALDLWAQPVPLEMKKGRAVLPVGPTPLIVVGIDTPLALLHASFRISPTYVQVHAPEQPIITFRNPYDTRLTGEVRLTPPHSWEIEPTRCDFVLEPGETFREALTLTLPPRQIARSHTLDVRLTLHAPESVVLHFPESLTVGLRDVNLEATLYWEGADLVIEQSLRNFSNQPVSFTAFCEPPGLARIERFFLDVAPGELSTQTYRFPASRHLAGSRVYMGIQEIRGTRSLSQFADVPQ